MVIPAQMLFLLKDIMRDMEMEQRGSTGVPDVVAVGPKLSGTPAQTASTDKSTVRHPSIPYYMN